MDLINCFGEWVFDTVEDFIHFGAGILGANKPVTMSHQSALNIPLAEKNSWLRAWRTAAFTPLGFFQSPVATSRKLAPDKPPARSVYSTTTLSGQIRAHQKPRAARELLSRSPKWARKVFWREVPPRTDASDLAGKLGVEFRPWAGPPLFYTRTIFFFFF